MGLLFHATALLMSEVDSGTSTVIFEGRWLGTGRKATGLPQHSLALTRAHLGVWGLGTNAH